MCRHTAGKTVSALHGSVEQPKEQDRLAYALTAGDLRGRTDAGSSHLPVQLQTSSAPLATRHAAPLFASDAPGPVEFTRGGADRKSEGAEAPDGRGRRHTT